MPTIVVKTIGATGADYTTLQAWEDAAPVDLVAVDQIWQGQIKNASDTFANPSLVISGSTSDATRYKELTTAPGASFRDHASVQTNALRFNAANGCSITQTTASIYAVTLTENYSRLSNVQISSTGSGRSVSASGSGTDINGCIFETADNLGISIVAGSLRNSLVVQRGVGATYIAQVITPLGTTNCTFVAPSDVSAATSAVLVNAYLSSAFKNCAFFGATATKTGNGTATFTTCYTSAASPPVGCTTVAYDTSTGSGFQNTLAASADFRIKTSSALANTGTTDATAAGTDIARTARPVGGSYDVGAWESGAGAASGTITFTAPDSSRVFQHAANVASVSASGTYTGTPTSIKAKLVYSGTANIVAGFGFATVVASPSGGVFAFTLTGIPRDLNWYQIVVEFTNDGATTATSAQFGVGELIGFCGQSNVAYQFQLGTNAGLTPSTFLRQTGLSITGWAAPDKGSVITFGNSMVTGLGCVVGLVNRAVAGTGLAYWISSGTGAEYNASIAAFQALGGKLCAIVFQSGEADWAGGAHSSASTHQAALVSCLDSGFRTALGQPALPVIVGTLGNYDGAGGAATTYDPVKQGQYAYGAQSANNYLIERVDLPTGGLHLTVQGGIDCFARYARAVLVAKGVQTQYRGPNYTRVTKFASTVYDVRLIQHAGTDITPATGITGFSVTDPGAGNATIAVSTAARQSASIVRLTLASAPVGLPVVAHLLGYAPVLATITKDNSALALPVEYNSGVAAIVLATSVSVPLVSAANVPSASLTGLKWAYWDQATPDLFVAPIVKGVTESTDASGLLVLDITGSDLTAGSVGWVTVTNSDGTTTQSPAHKAFSGPVVTA